ncbi:PIR Superfamily Protein [Plasmodium ovale curtisi]|uniref:PIR Superfamily Protein n=1 Tax=Plasmodium ovale curtisi TaxID=864141 RepID=A0A1A8X8B8_PLAOA|nr:PIR Superfamily Protein [Plasmodium ovale curtisi]
MTFYIKKAGKESYRFFEEFNYYVGNAEKAESINSIKEVVSVDILKHDDEIDFYEDLCVRADIEVSLNILVDDDIPHKLYDVTKHNFENIIKLYELYNIKKKIAGILGGDTEIMRSRSCTMYTNECYRKYREVIINCRYDCTDLYSALNEFKKKFKEEIAKFVNYSSSCNSSELLELPNYEYVLKEHKSGPFKKIITPSVLFPMFGIQRTKNMFFGVGESDKALSLYASDNGNIIGNQEEYAIIYYSA